MSNRFWFKVLSTQGICFPWRCEADSERTAFRKLWDEHQRDLGTARRITEKEADFKPYQLPTEEAANNPTC